MEEDSGQRQIRGIISGSMSGEWQAIWQTAEGRPMAIITGDALTLKQVSEGLNMQVTIFDKIRLGMGDDRLENLMRRTFVSSQRVEQPGAPSLRERL